MKYVFVPFVLKSLPTLFTESIHDMGAVTVRPGQELGHLKHPADQLYVMGHCAAGLDLLGADDGNVVDVDEVARMLEVAKLPRTWPKIVLIACEAASGLRHATSFAQQLGTALNLRNYPVEILASQFEVRVLVGKTVEVGNPLQDGTGKIVAADFVHRRAPLIPLPPTPQSGARPAGAGPSSSGARNPHPSGGSGARSPRPGGTGPSGSGARSPRPSNDSGNPPRK